MQWKPNRDPAVKTLLHSATSGQKLHRVPLRATHSICVWQRIFRSAWRKAVAQFSPTVVRVCFGKLVRNSCFSFSPVNFWGVRLHSGSDCWTGHGLVLQLSSSWIQGYFLLQWFLKLNNSDVTSQRYFSPAQVAPSAVCCNRATSLYFLWMNKKILPQFIQFSPVSFWVGLRSVILVQARLSVWSQNIFAGFKRSTSYNLHMIFIQRSGCNISAFHHVDSSKLPLFLVPTWTESLHLHRESVSALNPALL